MRNSKIKLLQTAAVFLLSMFLMSHLTAEEIIIQQEEISFEKCLEVIAISENKLLNCSKDQGHTRAKAHCFVYTY